MRKEYLESVFLFFIYSFTLQKLAIFKQIKYKYTWYTLKSKKDGKDQETIQSSTTPDPGHHMAK